MSEDLPTLGTPITMMQDSTCWKRKGRGWAPSSPAPPYPRGTSVPTWGRPTPPAKTRGGSPGWAQQRARVSQRKGRALGQSWPTNLSSVMAIAAPNQLHGRRDDLQPTTTRHLPGGAGCPRPLEAALPPAAHHRPAWLHTRQTQAVLWGGVGVAGALPCSSPGKRRARGGQRALPRLPKTHDSRGILQLDRENRHRPSMATSYLGPKASLGPTLLFPPPVCPAQEVTVPQTQQHSASCRSTVICGVSLTF